MPVHIYKSSDEFNHAVADWIVDYIEEVLKNQDRFTFVLSGGNTPKALHELLAGPAYNQKIDWQKIHFFWGDERDVPFEDERNNAKMAFDTLLNHVPVIASQIHIMRTDLSVEDAVAEYEKILHQYFPNSGSSFKSFDLVILGMGDDGHTLSLFPGTEAVHQERSWVYAFFLKAQDMDRITLTKTIVNNSSRIAFLTTGPKKAHALNQVLNGPYNPDLYPSQVIKPVNGELHWFVDQAAAAELK